MSDDYDYSLGKDCARRDWALLAKSLAEGNQPPSEATIQAVGRAAGGLPSFCSGLAALKATAALVNELKALPPQEQ